MSEFQLPTGRPRFREGVVYEGPFDMEAIADRVLEWLKEVDPPAVGKHMDFLTELADRKMGLEEAMLRSYDRLFHVLYDYCDPEATWGWEPTSPGDPTPDVVRLGFWPSAYGYRPTRQEEISYDALFPGEYRPEHSAVSPIGARLERSDAYQQVFLGDAQRLIDHLELVASGNDDEGFRLTRPDE